MSATVASRVDHAPEHERTAAGKVVETRRRQMGLDDARVSTRADLISEGMDACLVTLPTLGQAVENCQAG